MSKLKGSISKKKQLEFNRKMDEIEQRYIDLKEIELLRRFLSKLG